MRLLLPELIARHKASLDEAGSRLIFEALRVKFPEKPEGQVEWGKLLVGLTLPPLLFYWGRRDLKRFESIRDGNYEKLLRTAFEKIDSLVDIPYSDDWEVKFKGRVCEIQDNFLLAVRHHAAKWSLKNV